MKKKILFCLLGLNFISIAQVPTNSLSAYFPFNNNTLDYVGTRHGVSAGVAHYGTDRWGAPNSCYDVVDNSNHIMLPNDYWIYGDYSISAWVKIKQTESFPRLYDFSNGYCTDNVLGKLSHAGNGCPTIEYLITGQTGSYYMSNTPLSVNTWYHLVFISSGLQMSIYVNNVLIGTYTGNYTPQNVFRTSNKIGGSNAPLQDDTQAFIDDFRLYDRAITPEEVTQLFNEPQNTNSVSVIENKDIITNLTIFPNPATNQLSVDFMASTNQPTTVQVYDQLGKLVCAQKIETVLGQNKVIINTNNLAKGFYYLTLSSGEKNVNVKFVKD